MATTFTTDWLASKPVFYNTKTCKVSFCVNDVIDFSNVEFDPEGLGNYLDYGYSVFGQTPIKDVKFLDYSSKLIKSNNNLEIANLDDVALSKLNTEISEENLVELISSKVNDWTRTFSGKVVLPLSGGFDSRFLASLIYDKKKIKAFSYGTSNMQYDSFEVVKANEVAKRLNIDWEFVELGFFHDYFDDWDNAFGISVHSHGMYQMEFYKKILNSSNNCHMGVLSGIFGDIFSGNFSYRSVNQPSELISISYNHGMCADSRFSKLKNNHYYRDKYWERENKHINDPNMQPLYLIRLKMILISYLIKVPMLFNMEAYSPFLDPDVSMSILNLPKERKKMRKWQIDYFRKNNLWVEDKIKTYDRINCLNRLGYRKLPLKPLDVRLLSEIIDEKYVDEINRRLTSIDDFYDRFSSILLNMPKVGGVVRLVGMTDKWLESYCAYLTLKPLENLIRRRV